STRRDWPESPVEFSGCMILSAFRRPIFCNSAAATIRILPPNGCATGIATMISVVANPKADLAATTISRLNLRITPFLFLLYAVAYIDRINISFAAPHMQRQLGFNDAVYGLGAGMFFAGYLIFQVPATLVLQRIGARRSIAGLMIAWGLVSAATALVHSPMEFYSARFVLGVAEAGFFP